MHYFKFHRWVTEKLTLVTILIFLSYEGSSTGTSIWALQDIISSNLCPLALWLFKHSGPAMMALGLWETAEANGSCFRIHLPDSWFAFTKGSLLHLPVPSTLDSVLQVPTSASHFLLSYGFIWSLFIRSLTLALSALYFYYWIHGILGNDSTHCSRQETLFPALHDSHSSS